MVWTSAEVIGMVTSWLWPFFRIGAMLAVAPVFGARFVPARVWLLQSLWSWPLSFRQFLPSFRSPVKAG